MRDKISISEIAKRTGLACNTIKKWLKAPGSVTPKYLRGKDLRKLSSFEPTLLQALRPINCGTKITGALHARCSCKSLPKVIAAATVR